MTTPHIEAKPGEIAETVLLPGDPLRAKFVAENYLSDVVCVNRVRNMLGFTGTYKGEHLSVMSSGMGMPSMSIYATELFQFFDVQRVIRLGSCGSIHPDVNLGDLVVAMGASTDSNVNRLRFNGHDYAAIADYGLLRTGLTSLNPWRLTLLSRMSLPLILFIILVMRSTILPVGWELLRLKWRLQRYIGLQQNRERQHLA